MGWPQAREVQETYLLSKDTTEERVNSPWTPEELEGGCLAPEGSSLSNSRSSWRPMGTQWFAFLQLPLKPKIDFSLNVKAGFMCISDTCNWKNFKTMAQITKDLNQPDQSISITCWTFCPLVTYSFPTFTLGQHRPFSISAEFSPIRYPALSATEGREKKWHHAKTVAASVQSAPGFSQKCFLSLS